jgi:hypothetical protein
LGLAEQPAHGGFGDAVLLGEFADAQASLSVAEQSFAIHGQRWAGESF